MLLSLFRPGVLRLLLLLPFIALAQAEGEPLESDWLELVKGYKGKNLGTELVEIDDEGETRTITLAIPKTSMGDPDEIEEVVVIGRKPGEPEPLFNLRLEWLDDYDNDNYGLVIHLGKDSNWPIRLYMSSESGYMR